MSLQKLNTLPLGATGTVREVLANSEIDNRLMQLGFLPDVQVRRMYTDASGFISAYRIENTMIALRRCDAAAVLVEA